MALIRQIQKGDKDFPPQNENADVPADPIDSERPDKLVDEISREIISQGREPNVNTYSIYELRRYLGASLLDMTCRLADEISLTNSGVTFTGLKARAHGI